MIKNILFDVMGVVFIVGDDTNDLLVPFISGIDKNITKETIHKLYYEASLGRITAKEFWQNIGIDIKEIEFVEKKYLNDNLVIDPNITEVFKTLKEQGYKIGLLSNDVSEWAKYLRGKFNLDSLLDFSVISGEVNLRKPSIAIYEYVIKEYKIKPEESVFIDDRINNLIPAENLGFKTILFDRENKFKNNHWNIANNCTEIIEKIKKI